MSDDERRLASDAAKVERLLADLQGMVGPSAWQRVEELLQTVTGLYAAGLERALEHARASGANDELVDRLCEDELTSSLLLLHGLHPRPPRERIESALAAAQPRLGHAMQVVDLDEQGVLTLRPNDGALPSCPSSRSSLERTLEELVTANAPEVVRVQLDDGQNGAPRLVQLGLGRAGLESP